MITEYQIKEKGNSANLTATGGGAYLWSTAQTTANINVSPTVSTWYKVTVTNSYQCAAKDSVLVNVYNAVPATPGAISGNTIACEGTEGTYSVSAVQNATSYIWTVPSGWYIIGAQKNNSVNITAYTLYGGNITVKASNSCGTSSAQTLAVTVNAPMPAKPIDLLGSSSVCESSSQAYSTAAITGATTYGWTMPEGWTINSGQGTTSVTVTAGTVGEDGDIEVNAGNMCGTSDNKIMYVAINALPTAEAGNNQTTCSGNSASLTATGGGSYLWSTAQTSANISVSPTTNTRYIVTVTNSNQCTAKDSVLITVYNPIIATPGSIAGNTSVCVGFGQTYSISPVTGATSYTWSHPAGWAINSGQGTTSINASPGGAGQNGDISVVAINPCGTSTPNSLAVTSLPGTPAKPWYFAGPELVCVSSFINYSVSSVPDATTYTWTFPSGWTINSGQGNQSITVTAGSLGDDGDIAVTAGNLCGTSGEYSMSVAVFSESLTADAGRDTTIVAGDSVQIGSAAVSGCTYAWSPGKGLSSSTVAQPWAKPVDTTTYHLIVTNGNGCSKIDSMKIGIIPLLDFSINKDTIYLRDNIIFTNNSMGLPSNTKFLWKFKPCIFSSNLTITDTIVIGENISIQGYFDLTDSATITLSAIDANGDSLPYKAKIKKIAILTPPVSCPAMTCHDAITDPCINLVCNGDFEWNSQCPTLEGQLCLAAPWVPTLPYPVSPDYYNANYCGTDCPSGNNCSWVPINIMGNQQGHNSSNAYAGFISYYHDPNIPTTINTREYIHSPLKNTLSANQKYKIEMWVSLADNSTWATNGIQLYFSDTRPQNTSTNGLLSGYTTSPNFVDIAQSTCVADKTFWVKLTTFFTPTANNLSWVSIGNFKDDAHTYVLPTNPSGLFKIAYYYIDDISVKIAPNLVASSNNTDCPGNPVTINANYPCTHLWTASPGDPSLVGQETNDPITVYPKVTTTYTLTTNDPDLNSSITITVNTANMPILPIIIGDSVSCGNNSYYYISNYDPNISYIWSGPTGITFSPSNSSSAVTVNWPNNFIAANLTVTATNNVPCSSSSSIYVYECCYNTDANHLDFTNTTTSYIISQESTNDWSYQYPININGVLTVNADFNFENCPYVYMGRDADIIINSGKTLYLTRGTHLQSACNYMWDGITISDYSATLSVNGSTIEDANYAVVSKSGGTFKINGGTLINNYRHIIIQPYSGTYNSFIKSSALDCNRDLYAPLLEKRTYAGITITELAPNWTIGDASSPGTLNTFNNMWWGIISAKNNENAPQNITIQNNQFTKINQTYCSTVNPSHCFVQNGGTCIYYSSNPSYGVQSNLTIGGTNANNANYFGTNTYGCSNGIECYRKTNVNIIGNDFTNINNRGIFVNNVWREPVNIISNTFDQTNTSCYSAISTLYTRSNLVIYANNINVNTSGYTTITGINVSDNGNLANYNQPQVTGNNIKRTYAGIYAINALNFDCEGNAIDMPSTLYYGIDYGINVKNCPQTQIINNSVNWVNTPSSANQLRGIHVQQSLNSYIALNNLTKMGSGIRCYGSMIPSQMLCNQMTSCYDGVYLEGTDIGNQGASLSPWNNQWITTINKKVFGTLAPSASIKWYYNNNYSANYKLLSGEYSVTNGTNFLPVATTATSDICGSIERIGYSDSARTNILGYLVQNTYPDSLSKYNTDTYMSIENAYEFIKLNPSILSLDTATDRQYINWVNGFDNTNIGKIYQLNNYIAKCSFDTAYIVYNTLSPINSIEEKYDTVCGIFLNTWALDSFAFSSIDTAILLNIALQNPIIAGKAVYLARVMLDTLIDDSLDMGNQRYKNSNFTNSVLESTIKVYPNPAKNKLTIDFGISNDEKCILTLYDLLGNKIFDKSIDKSKGIVNLSFKEIPDGVYICRIMDVLKNIIFKDKLIIIK